MRPPLHIMSGVMSCVQFFEHATFFPSELCDVFSASLLRVDSFTRFPSTSLTHPYFSHALRLSNLSACMACCFDLFPDTLYLLYHLFLILYNMLVQKSISSKLSTVSGVSAHTYISRVKMRKVHYPDKDGVLLCLAPDSCYIKNIWTQSDHIS